VPENHLAGGFRIGKDAEDADSRDQEFVLFSQGRHVMPDSKYTDVSLIKLRSDTTQVKLGPLTIIYVKDGMLGGTYNRLTGEYPVPLPSRYHTQGHLSPLCRLPSKTTLLMLCPPQN
jgi:hypothetical protein